MSKQPLTVVDKNGLRGTAVPLSKADAGQTQTSKQVIVTFENGQQVVVDTEMLIRHDQDTYELPLAANDLIGTGQTEQVVIPLVQENLKVEKQTVTKGLVRIQKTVTEYQETVDEPLLREEVIVERMPINRVVDKVQPVRQEGDTMIVPVFEEVLVVEKRLMLKEELHIRRQQTQVREPQSITLRREEIHVQRSDTEPNADSKS